MNETTLTHEELIAALKQRVAGSAYALDMDFSRLFAQLTGRPETEVLGMVRQDTTVRRDRLSGRNKDSYAVMGACEAMLQWYLEGHTYAVTDLVGFIASHDTACVYAVLVRQQNEGARYEK